MATFPRGVRGRRRGTLFRCVGAARVGARRWAPLSPRRDLARFILTLFLAVSTSGKRSSDWPKEVRPSGRLPSRSASSSARSLLMAASASRSICLCVARPPPAPVSGLARVADYSRKWSALARSGPRPASHRAVRRCDSSDSRVRSLRQFAATIHAHHRLFQIQMHLSGSV